MPDAIRTQPDLIPVNLTWPNQPCRKIGRKYSHLTTQQTLQIYGVCEDCMNGHAGS
jgi:hypothetical protein